MTVGAGIAAQFGISTESVVGTYAAPSRFYEFDSESLDKRKNVVQGMGLRAGGFLPRSVRRVVTTQDAGGDVTLDLPTRGLGLLLSHAMGSAPSPTTLTTDTYQYVFTLGDVYGRSFSAQVGVPQYGGTVTPKTLTGCKVASFGLGVDNAGIAKGTFTLDAIGFTTTQSLAVASYTTTASVFHFAQGAITVDGGAVANIRDFNLSVDNALKVDRYNLGGAGSKSQQNHGGFRAVTGSLAAEFTDMALSTKYLTDASAAIVLTFTGAQLTGANYNTLKIEIPAAYFDADTPKVAGPDPVDLAMTYTALDPSGAEPLTITYITADAAL